MFSTSKLVFSFENIYQQDFAFGRNVASQSFPDERTPVSVVTEGTYAQAAFNSEATKLVCSTFTDEMDVVEALEPRLSQPDAQYTCTKRENYFQFVVTGYDKTQPLQIFMGNVLTAYFVAI